MKYWLMYDKNNELCGYSTYKQFEGQISVDELPQKFIDQKEKEKEVDENKKILSSTFADVLEYLEDVASDEPTKLSKEEFKSLCLKRKNARRNINVNYIEEK